MRYNSTQIKKGGHQMIQNQAVGALFAQKLYLVTLESHGRKQTSQSGQSVWAYKFNSIQFNSIQFNFINPNGTYKLLSLLRTIEQELKKKQQY
jgi:hypothetical protein